jgi:hypothetical protein
MFDIPKDKKYPVDSVQCDGCGGNGCKDCEGRGWLTPKNHPGGRKCANSSCGHPLAPSHIAVYCSNECAYDDA